MKSIHQNLNKPSPYFFFPTQLEIHLSDRCNLDCDYCFVNRNRAPGKTLNFLQVKKAIDIFLALPPKHKTVTFTTSEPFMNFWLYKKSVNYLLNKKKSGQKIQIVTTTNGLLVGKQAAEFVYDKIDDKDFYFNVSLDGVKETHNKHRKIKNAPNVSTFEKSWKNFCQLPKSKVRISTIITPDQVDFLEQNVNFFFSNGFLNLDLFPQMFYLWSADELKRLKNNLINLIKKLNRRRDHHYNLRLLNRLWGASHYAKLLLGPDANFYLCEWVLPLTLKEREKYLIGDVNSGIKLRQRHRLFLQLFLEMAQATNNKCLKCRYRAFCAFPLPLWLWSRCYRYNFAKYFNNFCAIAKIFIESAKLIDERFKNKLDMEKLSAC